jgi:hypothetical protein
VSNFILKNIDITHTPLRYHTFNHKAKWERDKGFSPFPNPASSPELGKGGKRRKPLPLNPNPSLPAGSPLDSGSFALSIGYYRLLRYGILGRSGRVLLARHLVKQTGRELAKFKAHTTLNLFSSPEDFVSGS